MSDPFDKIIADLQALSDKLPSKKDLDDQRRRAAVVAILFLITYVAIATFFITNLP